MLRMHFKGTGLVSADRILNNYMMSRVHYVTLQASLDTFYTFKATGTRSATSTKALGSCVSS